MYTCKKPTVRIMRDIYDSEIEEKNFLFALAERCILLNGSPIGAEALDEMPMDEFERLMNEVYPPKKP